MKSLILILMITLKLYAVRTIDYPLVLKDGTTINASVKNPYSILLREDLEMILSEAEGNARIIDELEKTTEKRFSLKAYGDMGTSTEELVNVKVGIRAEFDII